MYLATSTPLSPSHWFFVVCIWSSSTTCCWGGAPPQPHPSAIEATSSSLGKTPPFQLPQLLKWPPVLSSTLLLPFFHQLQAPLQLHLTSGSRLGWEKSPKGEKYGESSCRLVVKRVWYSNRMWLDWFNGWFHLMDEHWSESIFRLSQSVRLLKTVNQNLIHSCMIPWYMWKLIQFQLFHSFLSQYKCFLFSLMVKTCIYRC